MHVALINCHSDGISFLSQLTLLISTCNTSWKPYNPSESSVAKLCMLVWHLSSDLQTYPFVECRAIWISSLFVLEWLLSSAVGMSLPKIARIFFIYFGWPSAVNLIKAKQKPTLFYNLPYKSKGNSFEIFVQILFCHKS